MNDDSHCPECGEPIGQTATYCMHCSADLTADRDAADIDGDGLWDQSETTSTTRREQTTSSSGTRAGEESGGQLLAPDSLVDDTLTVVVGILGGVIVGTVATAVLLVLTESVLVLPFGLAAWLGTTAYLVRRRTVQRTVSKTGYTVASVLLLVPAIALGPGIDIQGGLEERGGLFVVLLVFVVVPATFAAVVGWVAGQFVPEEPLPSET